MVLATSPDVMGSTLEVLELVLGTAVLMCVVFGTLVLGAMLTLDAGPTVVVLGVTSTVEGTRDDTSEVTTEGTMVTEYTEVSRGVVTVETIMVEVTTQPPGAAAWDWGAPPTMLDW